MAPPPLKDMHRSLTLMRAIAAIQVTVRRLFDAGGYERETVMQAKVRVAVCSAALAYVCGVIWWEGQITSGLALGLAASIADIIVGACMIWWLTKSNRFVVPLRYLGIFADNVALTLGMIGAAEYGVAVFGVYLWVTIGNGIRFGRRFLVVSWGLSLILFAAQLRIVPFWRDNLPIGFGLLVALFFVPFYALHLANTLRRQKEAAEQLSNAKSRFVANVSHELRTPLTGVFAVYDLLRARKMTADDRELVGMLGSAVKKLKASVDAVLQMSKLEAGAERAERRPFNLWFLLQQLAALVRPQSAAKGLAWHLRIDPNVQPSIVGDPSHISHILGNLLNNAFKFTSAGSVSLRVFTAGEGQIRFEVIDTGIGIALDQQEHLFERFVQVDSSATRRHGGTGLGTSIARDLTELMGGKIGVVSAPGQGSTFWVELPLSPYDAGPQTPEWGARRQVLIVGEANESTAGLESALQNLGLEPVLKGDTAIHAPPSFDPQTYLAAVIAMPAADAAAYAESVLRERAGLACPWLVMAPTFSEMQRASLLQNGTAGLILVPPKANELRSIFAALAFRLDLPAMGEDARVATAGVVKPLTILLADDNKSNQLLLSRILKDAGHAVKTVERGDDAFDMMASGGLDLAILDLNMPDMTGPDVIKLYRASSVGGTKLPILILSADATPVAKQESISAGADEFLTKPVTAAVLLGAIERLSAGYAARGEPELRAARSGVTRTPASAAPVLVDPDRVQALRRIARGDSKFLDAYVNAAFTDLERALANLSVATGSSDVRAVRDALHIVEGTGASLGAVALVSNCRSMRPYLTAAQDPDRPGMLAELSTIYALTKSTILASLHEKTDAVPRSGTLR